MKMLIIGLTGTLGAGKGTIGNYLVKKGASYYSCSDELRKEIRKLGKKETRDNLRNLGNEIRRKYGAGELARRILSRIKSNKDNLAVVDSIRHPEEIKVLRSTSSFFLIFVDAYPKIRYNRIKKRARASDFVSFKKFMQDEAKEMKSSGPRQQLKVCARLADFKIVNNGSFSQLYQKVDKILDKIKKQKRDVHIF